MDWNFTIESILSQMLRQIFFFDTIKLCILSRENVLRENTTNINYTINVYINIQTTSGVALYIVQLIRMLCYMAICVTTWIYNLRRRTN